MRYIVFWILAISIVIASVVAWANRGQATTADGLMPKLMASNEADIEYELLEDTTGTLRLEDVLAPPVAARFVPPDSAVFLHPFYRTVYWMRLELPSSDVASTHLVELTNPIPAYVSFYLLGAGDQILKTVQTGSHLPFATRDVAYPSFVFSVDQPPGTTRTVLLRLVMESPASLKLTRWAPVDFVSANATRQLLWGAAYGILLVMALYQLNLFVTLRQSTFLYLVLYVLASCLNYAVVDGRAHQYLWPNHGDLVVYVWPLALSLVSIFLLLLTTSFLNTRQFVPKIHAIMLAFLIANIGTAIALIWADPLIILEIQFYLLIPTLVAVVAASIVVLYTGYTPARYFTLAQAVPLLIGIIPVVAALTSHPYTPIFRELSVPGNILMVMFTSFALADRIGFLQQENRSTWQALTESERRLVQYLEAIPVGIAVYGANQELTYVNQTALELADQPQGRRTNNIEEALASYRFYVSDTDLTYPLDKLPLTQALQGHISSVDDVEIATPARRYPAAMWATPVKNAEGQVEYAVCAFQDISTIRAAERVAREAQALYRRVVEDQPSFICRFLPDGRLSFANLAFTSFVESGTSNVVNASMFDMMEAEDAIEFRQSLDALNLTNQVSTKETRMRNGRGKLAWVQWTTRVLFDAHDEPSEYQALGLDVTKAKLAEFELAKYRNQLEDLVVTRTTALSQANTDLKRRAEELATLNVITRTLAATTELDVVLSEILVQLARVTAFECAQIYLRDGPWLTIAESVGPEAGMTPRQVAVTDVENAVVQVFTEQRTIVRSRPDSAPDNDATEGDQWGNVVAAYAHAEQENPAAWVGAPLLVGNESIGVLAVTAARTDTYGSDDVRNLSAFADQAAVAVLNARLNQQAQVAAASRERERLARELHDAVTQTLFSATIMAEALPQQWQVDPPGALVTLEKLRHMTRGALAEMRTLLWELRPGEVETVPFGTLLQHLGDALTGNTMVPVFVNCSPPDLLLPPEVQIALYRVAQEALNNIAKHANATGVEITARAETDGCTLCIRDDGCGFDSAGANPGHLGLTIMDERVEAIGGRLKISSVPGQGTEVLVQWSSSSGAG